MQTISKLIEDGKKLLDEQNIENSLYDARRLMMEVIKKDLGFILCNPNAEVDDEKAKLFKNLVLKRSKHYPLQYILGYQEFYGLRFKVSPAVLIPRADTEVLIERTIKCIDSNYNGEVISVLDMCTGSGCIGISIAKNRDVKLTIADKSKEALKVATDNLNSNEVSANIICTDLFAGINESFDIIVSNPPYIKRDVIPTLMPEVKEFEPVMALDGTEDGLYFYRRLALEGRDYLKDNGCLIMEIGYDQGEDVKHILIENGFKDIEIIKDYAGNDRVVFAH